MRVSCDFNSKHFISAKEDYEEVDGRVKREFAAPEYGAPDEFEKLTQKKMEFSVVVYNKRLDEEVKVSIVPMYSRLSHGEVTEVKQLNRNRNPPPDIPPLVFGEDVSADPIEENWLEKPSYIDYDDTNSQKVDNTGRLLFNEVEMVALSSKNTFFPGSGKNFKDIVKDLYKKGLEKKASEKVEVNDAWDYSELPDLVCGDDEIEENTQTQEMCFEKRLAAIAKKDVKRILKCLKAAFAKQEEENKKDKAAESGGKDEKKLEKEPSLPKPETQEKEVKSADKKESPKPSSSEPKVGTKKSESANPPKKEEKQSSVSVKKETVLQQKTQKKEGPSQEKDKVSSEPEKVGPKSSSPSAKVDPKKLEPTATPSKDKTVNEPKPGSAKTKKEEPSVQQKAQKKKDDPQQKDGSASKPQKEEPPVQQKTQKKDATQQKDTPPAEKKVEGSKTAAPVQTKENGKKAEEKVSVSTQVKDVKAQQAKVSKEPVKEVKFKPIATNREHMKRCGSHECGQAWIDEEKEDRVILTCTCECKIVLHVKCSKKNDAVKIIEDPSFDVKTEVPCPTPSCLGKVARIDYLCVKQGKVEANTKILIKPRPKKQPPPPKPKVKKTAPPSGTLKGSKSAEKKLQPRNEEGKKEAPKVNEKKSEDVKVNEKKKEDAKAVEGKKEAPKVNEKKSEDAKVVDKKSELPVKKEAPKKKEVAKKLEEESADKGKTEPTDTKKKPNEEEAKKAVPPSKRKTGSEASGEAKEAETGTRKSAGIIGIEEVSSSNEIIIPIQPKGSQPAGNVPESASGQQGSVSKKAPKKERLTKKQKKLALSEQFQQVLSGSELDSSSGKKGPQLRSSTNDWVNPEIVQKIKGVPPASGSQVSPGRKASGLPGKAKEESGGNKLKAERSSESQKVAREGKKNSKDGMRKSSVLETPFLPLTRDRIDIVVGSTVLCSINLNDAPNKMVDNFVFVSQFESDSFV